MKRIRLLALCVLCCCAMGLRAEHLLFEIGKQNGSPSEFALYPNRYKQFLIDFSGIKRYAVGHSQSSTNWPYALPGPKDRWGGGGYWAGYHPRHFPIINFQLAGHTSQGDCQLKLFFLGSNSKEIPTLRVEVNGHRFEKALEGKSTDKLLTGEEDYLPQEWTIEFPAEWLHEGMNQVQMGVVKGRWCMFDCIRLSGPEALKVVPISSSLVTSVQAAPFEYKKSEKKRLLPILVEMVQFDRSQQITFVCGKTKETRLVEAGESIQQIMVPAVDTPREERFQMLVGQQVIYDGSVSLAPQPLHEYADDVDLLMGTGNSRWMFKPSVSLPFGMVQIAPDNEDQTWKAGYEYTIDNISGFNHFCDWTIDGFLMQPTCGELKVQPGPEDNPDLGYRSRIDKSTEKAEVGKYSVLMTDTKIHAEVSATERASLQRYTFPAGCAGHQGKRYRGGGLRHLFRCLYGLHPGAVLHHPLRHAV